MSIRKGGEEGQGGARNPYGTEVPKKDLMALDLAPNPAPNNVVWRLFGACPLFGACLALWRVWRNRLARLAPLAPKPIVWRQAMSLLEMHCPNFVWRLFGTCPLFGASSALGHLWRRLAPGLVSNGNTTVSSASHQQPQTISGTQMSSCWATLLAFGILSYVFHPSE